MEVAFWSPMHGQTGTTSNLIAIACELALNYRLKVLITHNQHGNCSLERAFLRNQDLYIDTYPIHDTGIDALGRNMRLNGISQDQVDRYTTSILKNRLELLMGTRQANKELYLNEFGKTFKDILASIRPYYDITFVDLMAKNHPFSTDVIAQSDIVVVSLNQNTSLLDDFFENEYLQLKEKCFIVFGLYDSASRYCVKNIKRKYKFECPFGVVPYNRGFADAINEGMSMAFYLKQLNGEKKDPYYSFISQIRQTVANLMMYMNVDIESKKLGEYL